MSDAIHKAKVGPTELIKAVIATIEDNESE